MNTFKTKVLMKVEKIKSSKQTLKCASIIRKKRGRPTLLQEKIITEIFEVRDIGGEECRKKRRWRLEHRVRRRNDK